jgi:hypothetical protein
MSITRSRRGRQAQSITGRDGYIQMQALAYAIAAIELRPEEYQEWSNMEDMKLLLDHFCTHQGLKQDLLNGAKAHLTGIGHPASDPPGKAVDHDPVIDLNT